MHEERGNVSNDTFEVNDSDSIPKNIDEDLIQWIDQVNPNGDSSYTCTLYKYDHPKHGNRKEFCGSFEDESPNLEDIGNRYGGGRYLLYVVIYCDDEKKKKEVKSYKFKINDFYSRKNSPSSPLVPQIQQPVPQMSDFIQMFRDLITAMSPLLSSTNKNPDFSGNMTLVNGILRDSAKNQLDLMREFRNEITSIRNEQQLSLVDEIDDNDEDIEEPEQKMNIVELIEPLLEKYLPMLLGNGPQSKIAIAAVKGIPEFKRVLNDTGELSSLVQYIFEKEGKENTLKLMKKMKIRIDQLSEAVASNLQ